MMEKIKESNFTFDERVSFHSGGLLTEWLGKPVNMVVESQGTGGELNSFQKNKNKNNNSKTQMFLRKFKVCK